MLHLGKRNVLGILLDAVDYEAAVAQIIEAAKVPRPFGVTALAVHGVMTGVLDPYHRTRLNRLDLVTPDGQPVRWALDWLYHTRLPDRVYGPSLMLKVCSAAAREGLPIFLFGSRGEVLDRLAKNLRARTPGLIIAGKKPSAFRRITPEERDVLASEIRKSGARIVMVGLGCPRQEIFVYEMRERIGLPLLAVGAAFDFHAGFSREAPLWMQRAGLQWLHRFAQDPVRLWRRYVLLNPAYVALFAAQYLRLWRPATVGNLQPPEERYG